MSRRNDDMARLVELFATYRAYEEVSKTCTLRGYADMVAQRRAAFLDELTRYAMRYHKSVGDIRKAKAKAMDEVVSSYSQLTIWGV